MRCIVADCDKNLGILDLGDDSAARFQMSDTNFNKRDLCWLLQMDSAYDLLPYIKPNMDQYMACARDRHVIGTGAPRGGLTGSYISSASKEL